MEFAWSPFVCVGFLEGHKNEGVQVNYKTSFLFSAFLYLCLNILVEPHLRPAGFKVLDRDLYKWLPDCLWDI